uniref:Uncharacterized protein n=1 Tax=Candidatus Kentrum sp. DK TaxID=2126562 RepID=A0A450SZJ6_9GAMM|nr:MAG: hypothetical protein BECKDK2373B_GA0170837_108311 [Candidatus Kentron sp. DK]
MTLTKEEKEILDSVENSEWRRVPNFEQEAIRYRKIAEATLRKGNYLPCQENAPTGLRKIDLRLPRSGYPG